MIITREYARRLVRKGKAKVEGLCLHNGQAYMVVARYDMQRTDHYLVG